MSALSNTPSTSKFLLLLLLVVVLFSSPMLISSKFLCDKEDENTLMKIKSHFGNPPSLSSWNISTDCCSYAWDGIMCNFDNGKVNSLSIKNTTFSGPIPPFIGNLSNLDFLDLTDNPNLTGPIPPSITKLKYLTVLSISGSSLAGHIPNFLCKLSNVYYFDLSRNRLTGPVPGCIRTGVSTIDFSHNQLSGTIPSSFLLGQTWGDTLYLNDNQLTGQIPHSLANISFYGVDLSRNRLTGDASVLFGEKKTTKHIDLSENDLEFDMTNVSFPLPLRSLDLSHNRITGSISRQISKLGRLEAFDVSYNGMCGPIPTAGLIKQFGKSSYLHNKCLCGGPLQPCHH